ncbi:MAG TPA: hypothetical protein DCR71_02165, partial [Dehalococcoidia bacterium]|nr:hypothetical protein [Dehalococcoidia bacterium]
PLVIIHGGGDGAESWLSKAIQLAEHYTVYIPDLPGFGKSQSVNNEFDIPEYVRFIEEFAQKLNLENFYIMGHSVGGSLALHYALEYPHRIKKLIALNSFGLGKEIALWVRIFSSPIFIKVLGGTANFIFSTFIAAGKRIHPHSELKNPLPKIKIDIGRKTTSLSGQTNVIKERLAELLMPVLLISGKRDYIVPYGQVYSAEKLIPRCRVRVFPNCSHTIRRKMIPRLVYEVNDFIGAD